MSRTRPELNMTKLFSSGAIDKPFRVGPHRHIRPLTVSRWNRFVRWVRKTFNTWR